MKFSIFLNCETTIRRRRAPTGLNFQFIRKGFALIEFLLVIGIIGILVGISVPVFRQFQPSLKLSGAVRVLATDLRYAQQLAVTEQLEHCVRFFPEAKEYKIIQCQNPEVEEVLKTISLQEINSITLANFSNNEVRYISYGAVKKYGDITLEINGKAKIINVKPSGFIKVAD